MILEGTLMFAPLIVSFVYKEGFVNNLAFLIPIVVLIGAGFLLQFLKPRTNSLRQKEGFALVALVWLLMSLFGAIPFVINGDISNYVDAVFETMSGFTTTGSSIINDITKVSHSTLFWRSFTHWIGGMGILVFILIFIPESDDGSSLHLLRAESSGPQVGKIASKMKVTTRILYSIYLGMTILEIIILMCDKPIPGYESEKFFFSLLTTFGCAGTGGFGFIPGSMELFNPFSQYVVATFLILFGINFSLYYLILIGKLKTVLKSEELRTYLIIVFVSVGLIFINLITKSNELIMAYSTEEAFRHSYFQVASLMTTAGFTSTDYYLWPMATQMILICLMFIGGMAGSTGGGMKVSRVMIAIKGFGKNIIKLINPRYVSKTKIEGKPLEESTVNGVLYFFALYFFIIMVSTLILSFDPVNGTVVQIVSETGVGTYEVKHDFFSNFSSSVAAVSNIGPGFEAVGPYSSFANYSSFSKIVLTLLMMVGRLEILPVLILFSPKTWKKY